MDRKSSKDSTDDRADIGTTRVDGQSGTTARRAEPSSAADWPIDPGALPVLSPEAYQVGPEVGRGGMGSIARAVDRRLGRVVALKQLIRPSDGRRTLFAREAQLTARLQHPSIVRVYEAGGWPDGGLAYAMKLVSGRPLQQAIEDTSSLAERLGFLSRVIDIADAVAYAHSQRVIHRDITPSSIIVGQFGESVLIDWSMAKILDEPESQLTDDELHDGGKPDGSGAIGPAPLIADTGRPRRTASPDERPSRATGVVGTPGWMAPEQAAGDPVDERADVYALGAVLYYVLAGRPPYPPTDSAVSPLQVMASPPEPLNRVEPHAPADLCAVVARAMSRDPGARYSAVELASELRRFTTGELVAAYRYTFAERFWRWVSRHRAAVTVAVVGALALAAAVFVSTRRIMRERDRAEAELVDATARADELAIFKANGEATLAGSLRLLAELAPGSRWWSAARVVAARADGMMGRELGAIDLRLPLVEFRFLPTGLLLLADAERAVLWNGATGERRSLLGGRPLEVSLDGSTLLTRRGDDLELVEFPVARPLALGRLPAGTRAIALSPEGRRVAVAAADGVFLMEPARPPRLLGPAGEVLRFSPRGDALFTTTEVETEDPFRGRRRGPGVGSWSLPDGAWRLAFERKQLEVIDPRLLVISPDGSRIGSRTTDGYFVLLNAREGSASYMSLPGLNPPEPLPTHIAFAPNNEDYAFADDAHQVIVKFTDGPYTALSKQAAEITSVQFLPAGEGLLSASRDGSVVVWWRDWPVYETAQHTRAVLHLAVARDGRSFATVTEDGTVHVWPLRRRGAHNAWSEPLAFVALATDGAAAFVPASAPESVRRRSPDGAVTELGRCPRPVTALAAAPGVTAALCGGGEAQIWRDGQPHRTLRAREGAFAAMALAGSDGLVTWSADGQLRRWIVAAGTSMPIARIAVAPGATPALAVAANGRWAAAAGGTRAAWVDLDTGALEPVAGADRAVALALSRDGRHLAAAMRDYSIVVRDRSGASGDELSTLRAHNAPPTTLIFSPDGDTLLSAAGDSLLVQWDLATGVRRQVASGGNGGQILAAAFADRGRAILWSDETHLHREEYDIPLGEQALRAWIAARLAGHVPKAIR